MSAAPSAGGEGGGRGGAPQRGRPASAGSTSSSSAATFEELLEDLDKRIAESHRARDRAAAATQVASSSRAPVSPSRFWRRTREAARRVLAVAKNPSPPSSSSSSTPGQWEASRTLHGGEHQHGPLNAAGTSSSRSAAAEEPARAGSADAARARPPEHQPVALTRSEYAGTMREALAKIQEGATADAAGDDGDAAFAEMERAMAALLDVTHEKLEPRKLPDEFATKWPRADADRYHGTVMDDPVILASGYSVDKSYQHWLSPQNTCPVTDQPLPHSLTFPNHLLRDMIAAWCFDHSVPSQSTTADTCSIPLALSDEHIQDILEKFSGNSALQQEALHRIQQLSKTSRGMQPCLEKWPDLVLVLINLRKKWKSTWTGDLEDERLTVILNLSMHRPNREILAGQDKLPAVLKQAIEKADRYGTSASSLAKVASVTGMLSESEMFRKRMLDIGGMKTLQDLLKIEDAVVRNEAATAIFALCKDGKGKSSALACDVPATLLECFMASDEFLLLLDCLPKAPHVLDKICDKAAELVNIVMAQHTDGLVTSQGIHSAISLINIVVQRDVGKMKVENLEDFKEWLQELSSKIIPMQTMLQVENIFRTLSEMFPAQLTREEN